MSPSSFIATLRARPWLTASTALLIGLLIAKYFFTLFLFDVPLGYDPGIYRYLIVKYAAAFPFSLPALRPWAQEYPYGLFLFTSVLVKAGIPVDWFLGWIWNAMTVILLCTLAWVTGKREGVRVGVLTLLMAFLSVAYFDGFASMYWKTFLALFFLILVFHAFERSSPWMVPLGALTILCHNQTGLILALVFMLWWIVHLPSRWKDPQFRKLTIAFAAIAVLGLVWYAPIWFRAFWAPLKSVFLLRGAQAPGGEFADPVQYLMTEGILLAFGIAGWVMSVRREKGSVWQLAPLVCAVFVVGKLVFYRRFFLQLDFFLLPFAAMALHRAWNDVSPRRVLAISTRTLLVILIAVQAFVSIREAPLQAVRHSSFVDGSMLRTFAALSDVIEPNAAIISLENQSGVWLLGMMPDHLIGAPGLFDYPGWSYPMWEKFLYGSHEDRLGLLAPLPRPLYFLTSDFFLRYYGSFADAFLKDPCFEQVQGTELLRVICPLPSR
ncbi:MAG: hypothetical protein V1926_06520 [Candidatus Peregrinibacteria bacterium]